MSYAVRTTVSGVAEDVVLDVDDDSTGADLTGALNALGVSALRPAVDGVPVADDQRLDELPLLQGARIQTTAANDSAQVQDVPHLVVVSGPEAGAWYPLTRNRPLRVGRADGEVVLSRDEWVSNPHAEFDFDGSQVTVTDLGSSNGTHVEGKKISAPTVITPDTLVHVGSSVLAIVPITGADRAVLGVPARGAYPFPRTFRPRQEELTREFKLPRAPSDDTGSGSTWWRALVPLVGGVLAAFITQNFLFLLISGLAPLVYAGDAFVQKRRRKRASKSDRQRFEENAASTKAAFAAAVAEELRRNRTQNPAGGTANVFALVRHRRLWERRPSDPDFLSITFGLATRPSSAYLLSSFGDSSTRETQPMWGTPVAANLVQTGSIAVIGPPPRARAVVRGLLMGLAATHAPNEVVFWMFAANNTDHEWSPMRWLPHIAQWGGTCRIASTQNDRSNLMSGLRQVIDARRDEKKSSNDGVPLPVHVVVIDGAGLLPPADLAAMLVEGRAVGVYGIVVDASAGPEGVMGTLELGKAADEAIYESHITPKIEGVLTAEMPSSWAEGGARRMAALQPSTAGRATLGAGSERLAKILNAPSTGATDLASQWRQRGANTNVPVGTVSDAVFAMDVIRQGPHGLIGGTNGSGKTEFLKTLIASLAWSNHPDDLNFVIVDFKGGLDYAAMSRLPQVLQVSSNQDIAGFERTLQMLTAEQLRRQAIYKELEVSTLDAYRDARRNRPDLPVLPRLIVLIDEFAELLSNEDGREQLSRIESMSRIGRALGVHLLLITQNFEGQLPPQIAANAGLRISFRVQEPSNSRVVIDSPLAATIPASAPGRGYARMQGGDPIEFQSARVASRRPEFRGTAHSVNARLQSFEALPLRAESNEPRDVRAEETDLYPMIETIRESAHVSGWTKPAIPWPDVLPAEIALVDVLPNKGEEIKIGRADVPEQQRQIDFNIRPTDEHLVLIGGPRADLNTALITIGCSAAASRSPDDLHIYGIDFAGRGLARIGQLPHCGGIASRNEPLAVRIAKRLVDEASLRRAELTAEGVSTLDELAARTGRKFPHILLFIAGGEKLSTLAGGDEQSAAAKPIQTLLAEGTGLGIQVVVSALPNFAMYRPGNYIDRRLVFEAADMGDYPSLGCPRAFIGEIRGPRRGVDTSSQLVVQLASLSGGTANEADVLDALVQRIQDRWPVGILRRRPVAITDISWPTSIGTLAGALREPPARLQRPLLVAIDNGTGEPIWIDVAETPGSLLVAGPRKSGRSSALMSIGLLARHLGWDVVGTAFSPSSPLLEPGCPFDVVELDGLDERLSEVDDHTLVLLDDINRLDSMDFKESTVLGAAGLVIAAGPAGYFDMQRGLGQLGVRPTKKMGFSLLPETHTDTDAVGAKSDAIKAGVGAHRRPGQGLLGIAGEVFDVTIPLYDAR